MSVHWKAYHLNRMIQDALRAPDKMERLFASPEMVFNEYGLQDSEKQIFRNPSANALRGIGVHPILAMVYMIPLDPLARKQLTVDPVFYSKLKEF